MRDQASEMYKVKPGCLAQLLDRDPRDKGLWVEGSKATHWALLDEKLEELRELQSLLYAENKHKLLVVIQAMDTGGKDGCAKKVFSSMDPQGVIVRSFKKPSSLELAHDFLWRVHAKVPQTGMIAVFNRSHYEDVIAVRVKKLMPEKVWRRRYQHIIDFERMLSEEGTKIVKIFLNISKEEQASRLQERLDNPDKHWKFFPDDVEDREKWDEFMLAYDELLTKTSTEEAPWHVIPADRKWYRNLTVAQILINEMKSLNMKYPSIDWDPTSVVID